MDVSVASPDGRSTGYAEASVTAARSAPDPNAPQGDMQAALYSLTKQLMDDMNVQLQYQMQQNLSGWLSWAAPGAAGRALAGHRQLSGGERSSRHDFRRRRRSAPGVMSQPPGTGTGTGTGRRRRRAQSRAAPRLS